MLLYNIKKTSTKYKNSILNCHLTSLTSILTHINKKKIIFQFKNNKKLSRFSNNFERSSTVQLPTVLTCFPKSAMSMNNLKKPSVHKIFRFDT